VVVAGCFTAEQKAVALWLGRENSWHGLADQRTKRARGRDLSPANPVVRNRTDTCYPPGILTTLISIAEK
jgi:hypothetical protein